MNFKNRTPGLDEVFEQRWKANDIKQNGVKQQIDHQKQMLNKMCGNSLKMNDAMKKEILKANSVNGRVENLEKKMKATSSFTNFKNRNNF